MLSAGKRFEFAAISIGGFPPQEGTFEFVDDFRLFHNAATPKFAFSQGGDATIEKYQEIFLDEGFIEITNLDMINKVIEGRFKANFKRTKKQILFPTGYPKFLEFQGVFHDSLTIN